MMLKIMFVSLLFMLLAAFGVVARITESSTDDEQEIRKHIDRIFRAYMQRDSKTVRETHAADWRGFIRPSRAIVRGVDHYMRDAGPILASPVELKSYSIVDFDLVKHSEVGLVSYIATMETEWEGVLRSDKLRVIDIYAKENGEWNQVGSQVSTHPDAQEALMQMPQQLTPSERKELLQVRESVWRSYFLNDIEALKQLVPQEVIAINAGQEHWDNYEEFLRGADSFAKSGGKLIRLEFPETRIQVYGHTAILYTRYSYEIESGGKPVSQSGRATEIFVRRSGKWVNTGWHLDSDS